LLKKIIFTIIFINIFYLLNLMIMRRLLFLFCMLAAALMSFSQSPDFFQYQAIVRDANGDIVADQPVAFQISIISISVSGPVVYAENHSVTTNSFGLVTLTVGNGNPVSGSVQTIDWGSVAHYMKVEVDVAGGTAYTDMGTVQLLSVPYALYAKSSGSQFSGNYNDLTNIPDMSGWDHDATDDFSGSYNDLTNVPALTGDVTGQLDANTVTAIQGMDVSSNIPANGQVLKWDNVSQTWEPSDDQLGAAGTTDGVVTGASFTGTGTKTLTLIRSNGLGDVIAVFTDMVNDADADPANELQTLSVSGNDLTISNGNTITLPSNSYSAGTGIDITAGVVTNTAPDQTVVVNSGTGVSVSGTYPSFTIANILPDQTVTITGGGATVVGGSYPNFTINSTDANTTYSAGSDISIVGTTINNTAPDQTVTITGSGATTVTGVYPSFTISSTDENTIYSAGSGIAINSGEISNTSPDQTVAINAGSGVSVTGTYPNFTIANTNPDQLVSITGTGAATVSGTYPNFTINATDANTTYTAGSGLVLSGTTFSHNAHTGDATGTTSLTVTGIQGKPVSSASPLTGQTLKYNGTTWVPSADDNTTYTAGSGISLSGTQINNTSPDQTVTISSGTGISVTGTYPNFSITNSEPNQAVSISGSGATTVTGTYPNFAISSTDNNTTYSAGTGLTLAGTTFSHPAHSGDISGTTSLTVTGIQGRQVTTNAPANGQVLKWNTSNSRWELGDDELGAAGTNDGVVTSVGVTGTTTKTITLTRSQSLPDLTATFTDDGSVYTAGTGINISGTVITNSAPDQTVTLAGSGATSISGTYPSFTISSTDNNTTYSAGTGLTLSGTTFNSVWSANGGNINNTNLGNVGIGNNSPTSPLHVYSLGSDASAKIGYSSSYFSNRLYFGDGDYVWVGEGLADDRLILRGGTMGVFINSGGGYGTNGQVLKSNGSTVSWQNETVSSAGSGISISSGVISNSAPDQTVVLNYAGATTVTGTYPSFTISSTDENTTYTAGTGITLTGTTFSHPAHSGDVSGTTALTVTGIQGKAVSSTLPTSGQILKYNGTSWVPSTDDSGTGTVTSIATGNGITGGTITTTGTLGLTGQALALHNLATNGMIARTASGTVASRTITAGNGITISNGDGVSGNPTIAANFGTTSTTVAAGNHTHTAYGAAGLTGQIQFNSSGVFDAHADLYWDDTNARMGVGTATPNGRMVVKGSSSAPVTEPLFEVKDDQGYTVFVVYKDSVRIFFDDDAAKTNKGTFAVSGRNTAKQMTHNYLLVRPDSTRIYTGDSLSGFGVENVGTASESYMKLTPRNYFIGHEAGSSIVSGRFNSFIGYQSGAKNKFGNYNLYIGYRTGYQSTATSYCTMLGYLAGENNTSNDNTFIGYKAGSMHQGGGGNVFLGSKAGQNDLNGAQNVFIGENCGFNNGSGQKNIFMGVNSGYNNLSGNNNLFLGVEAGNANTIGTDNIFMGYQSGFSNTEGQNNIFIGNSSGKQNIGAGAFNGDYNVFIGYASGQANTTGISNVFIGDLSGSSNETGNYNVYIGKNSSGTNLSGNNVCIGAQTKANGNNNVMLGTNAGYQNTGTGNVFIGTGAGTNNMLSNRFIVENSTGLTNPMIYGDFVNDRISFHALTGSYPLQVGTTFTNGNGAFLTTGGTWTNGSSRTFKDRYTDLNPSEILDKIEQMELKGWFYKGTQEYHIGPFAEDFYQAFGTGVLDVEEDLGRYLSPADVAGVSMVAIQELIRQSKKQNLNAGDVEKIKSDNESLRNQIDRMQSVIDDLNIRLKALEEK
jgi:hypothetical protein